jgi:hypothetical protein
MDKIQRQQWVLNLKVIEKMIAEYEELKSIPNINPCVILAYQYVVIENTKDEHEESLGI